MNSYNKILALALISFIMAACHIDYDLEDGVDNNTQPDILMEGVVQIQKDDNHRTVLKAERASFYTNKGESHFENMEFFDYGNGDIPLRKGGAGMAELFDNNDARLSGGVFLESFEDEIIIEADNLNWNDEASQLSSPVNGKVYMRQKGEKEIGGKDFLADFHVNEISFGKTVAGVIVLDE